MSTELERVTAALEALGDDATAEEIAEAIRSYSKRDIAAAMFSLTDGGGGSHPLQLLGPYPIAFNTPGIEDDGGVTLTTLAAGTIIITTWAFFQVDWDIPGCDLNVVIGPVETAWGVGTFDAASGYGTPTPPQSTAPPTDPSQFPTPGIVGASAAALIAQIVNGDGAAAGECDIYALVWVPA